MNTDDRRSLAAVLRGLIFPAQRWEIVTLAGLYGADVGICDRLRRLPRHRSYYGLADIVAALDLLSSNRVSPV